MITILLLVLEYTKKIKDFDKRVLNKEFKTKKEKREAYLYTLNSINIYKYLLLNYF